MRLTRIEARDFLSYEALDLDLSDVSQVVVVGQNGHGKSALLDAVLWCLYGEGRASADQMVRHGALSSWVKVKMEVAGQCVSVTRHRSKETKAGESSLNVEFDGVRVTRHTIAETQEVVDRIVGLPARTLMAGPFMVQGQSDTLMRARPAERKDLIIRLLALDRFERYHAAVKDALAALQSKTGLLEMKIADAEAELGEREGVDAQLEMDRVSLTAATEKVVTGTELVAQIREEAAVVAERAKRLAQIEQDLQQSNVQLDDWTRLLGEAEGQLAQQKQQALGAVSKPTYEDTSELEALIAKGEEWIPKTEEMLTEALAAEARRQSLVAERDRIAGIIRIRDERGVCATCPFVEVARLEDLELVSSEIDSTDWPDVEARRRDARTSREQHSAWKDELAAVERRNEALRVDYERAVGFRDLAGQLTAQTEARIDQLRSAVRVERERILAMTQERMRIGDVGDVADLAMRLTAASEHLREIRSEQQALERRVQAGESKVAELVSLGARVQGWEEELASLRGREAHLSLLAKAWHRDGVPTLILENALPVIESRANEVLARMPGDFAVRLVTQRARKVGGMIETLDVVVETEGQERDYDLLSGGERFRVDLALRVSLAELLTRRSGAKIETLWLDEPLAALDASGRDAVISSLAAIEDEFQLIVVVSHHDEFNDRFPARIEVTKQAGVSTAEVAA